MGKLGWTLALLFAVLLGYVWYEPAFDPESLRGARVVVTGCSTGIGEQMAYHYARLGARVLITARSGEKPGKIGNPLTSFYAATKFGLDGFFASLRQELVMQDINVSVTYCVLGFIGTETSQNFLEVSYTRVSSEQIKPSPPSDCAMAIIKGGATRQREIYYPWRDAWLLTKLRPFVPDLDLVDHVTRSVFPPLKEKSPLFTTD
ncbi:hydroxysteroid 11-beta-dehydrogenase 1-like protein [Branchiostoma floridae x Branchiostoma japonicum]